MEDLFSIIEKSMKNSSRHYGDVRVSEFECGCKILTANDEFQYTVFKDLCLDHREECEKMIGKEAVEKIILKDTSENF